MRTEKNKDGTRKVWITREEFESLLETVESTEKEIAIALMGKIGLRVGEVLDVSYNDIRRTSDGDGFVLEVDGAKDTTGEYNGGKQRDVYLDDSVERKIFEYIHNEDIDEDEPLIGVSTKRSLQIWLDNIAEDMVEITGEDNWDYLSCHDLRRSLVTHLIHNEGVQISIVQNQMGWGDISTVKNYLDKPTESVIKREFSDVEL